MLSMSEMVDTFSVDLKVVAVVVDLDDPSKSQTDPVISGGGGRWFCRPVGLGGNAGTGPERFKWSAGTNATNTVRGIGGGGGNPDEGSSEGGDGEMVLARVLVVEQRQRSRFRWK